MGEQTDELYRRLTRIENALTYLLRHHIVPTLRIDGTRDLVIEKHQLDTIFNGEKNL